MPAPSPLGAGHGPSPSLPTSCDVVVAGAGLAGLCAALTLRDHGLDVVVVEKHDAVGGRVRTDVVDGLRLDRGFQLLNPAYPEARRRLDLAALDLRAFDPGLLVAMGSRTHRLVDPRRGGGPGSRLGSAWSGARAPVGGFLDKARFAAYVARAERTDIDDLLDQDDVPAEAALREAGIGEELLERALRPFLAGVFLEPDLTTSRRFLDLVLRSFARGVPAVPAGGMQAIPEQLAAGLGSGTVHLGVEVESVTASGVRTSAGPVGARAVVVATDPVTAGALLPDLAVPRMRPVTTWYHVAEPGQRLTDGRATLVVDGQRRGPVVNSVVLTHAAPEYATDGRTLVSSSVLGVRSDSAEERDVRGHLGLLHGVDTRAWVTVGPVVVRSALPAMPPPHDVRQPVRVQGGGPYVAGDHRDTGSIQGAMVSGRRAAEAVLADLGVLAGSTP